MCFFYLLVFHTNNIWLVRYSNFCGKMFYEITLYKLYDSCVWIELIHWGRHTERQRTGVKKTGRRNTQPETQRSAKECGGRGKAQENRANT